LGKDAIVFENGGYIYRYDIPTGQCAKVDILIDDDLQGGRGGLVSVADKVTNFEIAPDGKRALFGARGDVFTVPAKHGAIRNLTSSPGVHDRNSKWSPDGKWIAYISDASGEDEIWVTPQDGRGPARQVTKDDAIYKYQIEWSPDSRKILWADKGLRLRFDNVETGVITEVCKCDKWEFNEYAWSPDSQWIVYTKPEVASMSKIYLYSLKDQTAHELTDGWYDSSNPSFSSDGRFVFFVSDRDFDPIYSRTEWNHAYQDMSRIYLITLAKATESPFKPQSDEVEVKATEEKKAEDEAKKPEAKDEKKKAEPEPIKVDLDGIKDRIAVLPIAVSSYASLVPAGDQVYYIRRGGKDDKAQLCLYDLKEQKETELGQIDGFEISADKKKMLVASGRKYAIIDLPKGKIEMKDTLDLSGMEVHLDKRAEWRQIFNECWRQMRDFFHVPNMHGVDWQSMRARYEPLVAYVNHRADLTYIIGEMIGELNAGHTTSAAASVPSPSESPPACSGRATRDAQTGYYKITKILPRRELAEEHAVAPDGDRRRRERGRLHSRHRRPLDRRGEEHSTSCWSTRRASR
jgi:tricorn protease